MPSRTAHAVRTGWIRLLPNLLPYPWPAIDMGRQAWNIGPGDRHSWTVLDDLPMPTDQKVGGSSPSERAQVKGLCPPRDGAFAVSSGAVWSAENDPTTGLPDSFRSKQTLCHRHLVSTWSPRDPVRIHLLSAVATKLRSLPRARGERTWRPLQ
jgi:hypothetical protein